GPGDDEVARRVHRDRRVGVVGAGVLVHAELLPPRRAVGGVALRVDVEVEALLLVALPGDDGVAVGVGGDRGVALVVAGEGVGLRLGRRRRQRRESGRRSDGRYGREQRARLERLERARRGRAARGRGGPPWHFHRSPT